MESSDLPHLPGRQGRPNLLLASDASLYRPRAAREWERGGGHCGGWSRSAPPQRPLQEGRLARFLAVPGAPAGSGAAARGPTPPQGLSPGLGVPRERRGRAVNVSRGRLRISSPSLSQTHGL